MKKFMVLYISTEDAVEKMKNATPEEMMEGMKPWMEWQEKIGDALVDMGNPFGAGKRLTNSGEEDTKDNLVGYGILQAESLDDAMKLVEGHPHLAWNEESELEVYEIVPVPGME